jgi:hypothetical protein
MTLMISGNRIRPPKKAPEKQLEFSERVIEIAEYLHCDYHGDYPWQCYYNGVEIVEMIDGQGFVDCPLCLVEIVGIE